MPDRLGNKARLQHILEAILEIKDYIKEVDNEQFEKNSMMKNAAIRQLEVIGEASNRLTEELRNEYSQVAWKQIIGLRNILIHEYFGVDETIIWNIITIDIPVFESHIKLILQEIE
jgi:uncharacterized protein with HEPN domain